MSFRSARTYFEELFPIVASVCVPVNGEIRVPEVFLHELFRDLQASRFHTSLSLIVSIA